MHVAGSVKQNQLRNKESLSNWRYYYVMLYAIWYHLKNFKNVKNTHGRVLLVVKLQASACNFTKSNTSSWVILYFFLNCTNRTKSRKASTIFFQMFLYKSQEPELGSKNLNYTNFPIFSYFHHVSTLTDLYQYIHFCLFTGKCCIYHSISVNERAAKLTMIQ